MLSVVEVVLSVVETDDEVALDEELEDGAAVEPEDEGAEVSVVLPVVLALSVSVVVPVA